MAAPEKRKPGAAAVPAPQPPPAASEPVARLLARADQFRRHSRWKEAGELYALADRRLAPNGAIRHNLALCMLGLGRPGEALSFAEAALALQPGLWQSQVIRAKALVALNRVDDAIDLLRAQIEQSPGQGETRLELAGILLHKLGDAHSAQQLATPLLAEPRYAADAALTRLMARLYDRDGTPEALTSELVSFADRYLKAPGSPAAGNGQAGAGKGRPTPPRRRRVGLISTLFCSSPVYFFCIGSLSLLANEVDFVVINRGLAADWATRKFRAIAHEWVDAASLDAASLAELLQKQRLDVLFDLGGWMDSSGMRAIATKPAGRMYKWVGGQSATTGLRVFDGMLTDRHQSPRRSQHLYTEPLVLLKSGYVTYAAPHYLPAPAKGRGNALGVISNPAKVSRAFLSGLAERLVGLGRERPLSLRFIDQRYRSPHARSRILTALRAAGDSAKIEFVAPASHRAYLEAVGALDVVVDTWPYTGGLTTIEALAMGVPCLTKTGKMFSERHTYAHCRYAGLPVARSDFARADIDELLEESRKARKSLLQPGSARLNHAGLATELASLINRT